MAAPQGTIIVTGTSGTLGSAIVAHIGAEVPEFHNIYTVRDATASHPTLDAARSGQRSSEVESLDLTKLEQVRAFAAKVNARVAKKEIPPIRALICNAGFLEFEGQTWTPAGDGGFDSSFASNYLGHWLLSLLLLQSLDKVYGRVVLLGSAAHNPYTPVIERHYNKDPKWMTFVTNDSFDAIAKGTWSTAKDDPTLDSGFRRYGAAKMCVAMNVGELQRRLKIDPQLNKITIVGVDPGTMASGIVRRSSWFVRNVVHHVILANIARVLEFTSPNAPLRTPPHSARDVVEAGMNFTGLVGGSYMNGSLPGVLSPEAKDEKKWVQLWKDTIRYTGLKEGETALADWK